MNWLLVFIPIALVLEWLHAAEPWIFFAAALAIVPVAALIVRSTEQVATYTGPTIGGLLNASFGNAPELIVALVALRAGLLDMVRASLIGGILANLLLALGIAFLAGGMRYHTQNYNAAAARLYGSMMLIASFSLIVPSAFSRLLAPEETVRAESLLNFGLAAVLLAAYALYLVFQLKTHSLHPRNSSGFGIRGIKGLQQSLLVITIFLVQLCLGESSRPTTTNCCNGRC